MARSRTRLSNAPAAPCSVTAGAGAAGAGAGAFEAVRAIALLILLRSSRLPLLARRTSIGGVGEDARVGLPVDPCIFMVGDGMRIKCSEGVFLKRRRGLKATAFQESARVFIAK